MIPSFCMIPTFSETADTKRSDSQLIGKYTLAKLLLIIALLFMPNILGRNFGDFVYFAMVSKA